jgi:GLPGLI family protein
MYRRFIVIILALAAVCSMACAQNKQAKIAYIAYSNIDKYITIDTAIVRVWYALNALDINDENSYIDWQILEVGSHCTKYYSYFVWESDSLQTVDNRTNRSGRFSSSLLPRGRNGHGNWNELQYHVLIAENGKIRTYNRERLKEYEGYYDEPFPDQQWTLTQDTATVSGYHCQKATCHFHGRDFEAWFTPEVPVKYGPWKFGGLPGLIVKVYDTAHLYTFECTNVERVNKPMVRSKYSRRRPIKRETVLKFERKLNECPGRTLGAKDNEGNIITTTYPYEPLELE